MANVSDIEDGFALKHRREKGRAPGKKRRRAPRGEHTIPPPPAKHILGSFTLANPTSKRAVSDYVETQARGEKVLHAEKVKSEHILGRDYVCWDVHTKKDRYWVITSPSNLYSQRYFPSLDFTLSFHVGVTARIVARSRGAPDDAQKARLTPAWRRWEQAAETLDMAEEAEDFQAVGVKCRECLIQFARSLAKLEMVPPGEDAPQRSNFISWSELIANAVAGGGSAERIRGHLKAIAKSAWELTGWLTHANGGTRQDAVFVLDATHAVLAAFGRAIVRHESGSPERCPNCGSYNLDVGFNPELPQPYVSECEECGWQSPEMR
jgi:predicted RNA-binding Zn-ribbon protein involved in translation (DUF1610 family)